MKKFLCLSVASLALLTSSVQSSAFLPDWISEQVTQTKQNLDHTKEYWEDRGAAGVLLDTGSALKTLGTFYNPVSIYYEEDPTLREIKFAGFLLLGHMPLDVVSEAFKIAGFGGACISEPIRIVMGGMGVKKLLCVKDQCKDQELVDAINALFNSGAIHTGSDVYVGGPSLIDWGTNHEYIDFFLPPVFPIWDQASSALPQTFKQ